MSPWFVVVISSAGDRKTQTEVKLFCRLIIGVDMECARLSTSSAGRLNSVREQSTPDAYDDEKEGNSLCHLYDQLGRSDGRMGRGFGLRIPCLLQCGATTSLTMFTTKEERCMTQ